MGQRLGTVFRAVYQQWALLNGAVLFYTCLPLPASWPVRFEPIALVVPVIGVGLGGLLAGVDILLSRGLPMLLHSAVVVLVWVWGHRRFTFGRSYGCSRWPSCSRQSATFKCDG